MSPLSATALGQSEQKRAEQAIDATVRRYGEAPIGDRKYVKYKLQTDPLTRELVRDASPLGDIIDVGCGRGQFGLLLYELGRIRSLFGYDWDQRKVAIAANAGYDVGRFQTADLRSPPIHSADTLLLFDVLQYLSESEQQTLLRSLVATLRPGGRILVRAADRSRGWQAGLSQALEYVGRTLGVNRSHTLVFRPSAVLSHELEALGLTVYGADRGSSSLLDNRLWVAERAAGR